MQAKSIRGIGRVQEPTAKLRWLILWASCSDKMVTTSQPVWRDGVLLRHWAKPTPHIAPAFEIASKPQPENETGIHMVGDI